MPRTRKHYPSRLGKRERCNALLRRPWTKGPGGRFRLRHPRCQAWAMPNGRCRFHGGLSTGPRSPEGKAKVVAAMVAGRRAWIARVRTEGGKLNSGRKSGAAWVTESMFTLDRRSFSRRRGARAVPRREGESEGAAGGFKARRDWRKKSIGRRTCFEKSWSCGPRRAGLRPDGSISARRG
jgi:hypothetical protein